MEELEELISKLESQIEEIKLHTDILNRCNGDVQYANRMLLDKQFEDGMIKNFHNASEYQLNRLKSGYRWHYYTQEYVEKLIDVEILRKKREKKLNRIIPEE